MDFVEGMLCPVDTKIIEIKIKLKFIGNNISCVREQYLSKTLLRFYRNYLDVNRKTHKKSEHFDSYIR